MDWRVLACFLLHLIPVFLRKVTGLYRHLAQSLVCGCFAAALPWLGGKWNGVIPLKDTSQTAQFLLLLAPALGMSWVFTVVDSLFWRAAILLGALVQLPLAGYLAFRFDVAFSPWPLAFALIIAAFFPEFLRNRARKASEIELDPTFFQPSIYRPNPTALAESAALSETLPPQRVGCSVLFCELVNHAALADSLPPNVWTPFLNRLLSVYLETVLAHGGRADRSDNEGFRAVFCNLYGAEEHPEAALHAALAIRARVSTLSQDCAVKFGLELDVRMGVSTGDVLLASFGSSGEEKPGVAGETAEWAKRLAGANLRYGTRILIGARTGLLGGHSVERRPIDLLQRHPSPQQPEDVFEVLALQHTLDSDALNRLRFYREGVNFFRARKWTAARASLLAARPIDRSDETVDLLLMRINEQEALAACARA